MTLILIQGGGDLGTGIAMRLHRAGFRVLITELAQPLAVRRAVCFSEAIYEGAHSVEGLTARRAATPAEIESAFQRGEIPVVSGRLAVESWQWAVDSFQPPNHPTVQPANRETVQPDNRPTGKPENWKAVQPENRPTGQLENRPTTQPENRKTEKPVILPAAIIDARLLKSEQAPIALEKIPLRLGLGPGFTAGVNCHAAIETNRGHLLGRVLWQGAASADTGLPEGDPRRVLRAPADGLLTGYAQIGETLSAGQLVARVNGEPVFSPFPGVLRGLVRSGLRVTRGVKIGDVDARGVRDYCFLISDKSLAIGGAALEAVMSYGLRP